ncbi:hypothetical protein ANCDUO_12215 [Ancylostoma duodenale]|uniref:DNA helicase Pif1-like 2B domain-containing protein n=1 Tax=Ancylostoma duodenale TaxID=51022 RepID=A0A0C2GKH8_9BILA|nr:hypothetical protein ANCDUO_12215 [Ancylostoma duodenale]
MEGLLYQMGYCALATVVNNRGTKKQERRSAKGGMLARINSEGKVYKSIDEAVTEDSSDAIQYQREFLRKVDPPGVPTHELRLREEAIVMLLRNLDISAGLCNDTRLVVEHFRSHMLGC